MKSSLRQLSFLLLIPVVFVLLPLASVYAATTGSTPTTPPAVTGSTPTTPPSSVGGTIGSITLANPLKVDSIEKLLQLILDIILIFATPIIVFFIIYSGFLFVTAQGNDAQLTKAKTALLWTVIGGVIVLGANVLLDVLVATVKSLQP